MRPLRSPTCESPRSPRARRMSCASWRAQLESQGHCGPSFSTSAVSAGTSVHPAVLLADRLLPGGVIGRVRTAEGEMTYQADSDALFRGLPIAVLVDDGTSGTAEWLAAALQDNHRAMIVGTPTFSAMIATQGRISRPSDVTIESARRRRLMVDRVDDGLPRARRRPTAQQRRRVPPGSPISTSSQSRNGPERDHDRGASPIIPSRMPRARAERSAPSPAAANAGPGAESRQ